MIAAFSSHAHAHIITAAAATTSSLRASAFGGCHTLHRRQAAVRRIFSVTTSVDSSVNTPTTPMVEDNDGLEAPFIDFTITTSPVLRREVAGFHLTELSSPLSHAHSFLSSATLSAGTSPIDGLFPSGIEQPQWQRWEHVACSQGEYASDVLERYSIVTPDLGSVPAATHISPDFDRTDEYMRAFSSHSPRSNVPSLSSGATTPFTSTPLWPTSFLLYNAGAHYPHHGGDEGGGGRQNENPVVHCQWNDTTHQVLATAKPSITEMSIAELQADGWHSSWPHHTCRLSSTPSGSQRTTTLPNFTMSGQSRGQEKRVHPAIDDADRQFFEVKSQIQAIPETGDPARFQQNGRCLIACDACKRRKMRCTNEFPTCANCNRRGTPCNYAEKVRTRGRAKTSADRPARKPSATAVSTAAIPGGDRRDSVLRRTVKQEDESMAFTTSRKSRRIA